MNSIIIGFVSSKGGSGKTVTSTSISTILSEIGKKVLIIDTDASTNGLSLLFLDEIVNFKQESNNASELKGIFEIENGEVESLVQLKENLYLLPSTYVLKQTEDVPPLQFKESLHQIINIQKEQFDYIIIDAQAGSDIYAKMSIEECDYKIIVSEYDPISAEGVERLKHIFSKELPPEKTWVLLNKVLPDFAEKLSDYMSVYKFLSPIPWDADVIKSFAKRSININTTKVNAYTLAIIQTIQSLGIKKLNNAIEDWISNKELELKEPAKKQVEKLNYELDEIEKMRIDLEYQLKDILNRNKSYSTISLLALSIGAVASIGLVISSNIFDKISIEDWKYSAIAAGLTISILIYTLRDFFTRFVNRKGRESEKKIMTQLKYYERTLEELKAKKEKLDFITYSEFEDIVRNK